MKRTWRRRNRGWGATQENARHVAETGELYRQHRGGKRALKARFRNQLDEVDIQQWEFEGGKVKERFGKGIELEEEGEHLSGFL